MSDENQESLSSKLILPPLPFKNQPIKQISIKDIFSALSRRKQQFQSSLFQQQENNAEYSLQYSHNLNPSNVYETLPQRTEVKNLLQYSRLKNSGVREKCEYRPPKINKLIESQINIKIVPLKHTSQKSVMTQNILQEKDEQIQVPKQQVKSEAAENTKKKQPQEAKQKDMPEFQPTMRPVIYKSLSKSHYEEETPRLLSINKKTSMKSLLQMIKQLKNNKTNDRLQRTANTLQILNPFFSKIQRVVGICLLRVGTIRLKQPRSILYEMDEPYTCFYIILTGRIKLIGRDGMHKICDPGEVLLEEIIMSQNKCNEQAVALQRAKIIEESYLMEIERKHLVKLEKELIHYGYKQGLWQLQSLIKRNAIAKNWLRNKFRLLQQV